MTDAAFRRRSRLGRSWVLALGGVLTTLCLVAACGDGDAVDVTPTDSKDLAETAAAVTEQGGEIVEPAPTADGDGDTALETPVEPDTATAEPAEVNGWIRISPPGDFYDVVAAPDGQVILSVELGEGLISRDGGRSWDAIDWPGERRSRVAIDPSGQRLVVGGISSAAGFETTVVWSADGGRSWVNSGRGAAAVAHYTVTSFLFHTSDAGLLASEDGGLTGTTLVDAALLGAGLYDPFGVSINPRNPDDFFVISVSEGGTVRIVRTLDGGVSVEAVADGFALWGRSEVHYSAIGPMIMSQGVGVLLSFDQGATWFEQTLGLEDLATEGLFTGIVDFTVLPASSIPIVAAGDAIYRFNPGGWEILAGPGGEIRALAVQQGEAPRLLAATSDGLWAIPVEVVARF